jgi:hypothetical protein
MSVDPEDSAATKLKNIANYKLHSALDNPDAKKFAQEQKAKQEEQALAATAPAAAPAPQDQSTDPPSAPRRILTKIWSGFTTGIRMLWYPFACLVLAIFVANDMIVYTAPVRVLFFVFTFLVCYFFSYMFTALLFGYAIKAGYQWYIHNTVGDKTKNIMPAAFTILPITTYQPTSPLGSFFYAPFWYPQSEKKAIRLSEIMQQYWNQLQESFPGFNEIKNLPVFTEGLKQAKGTLDHMHDPPPTEENVEVIASAKNNIGA